MQKYLKLKSDAQAVSTSQLNNIDMNISDLLNQGKNVTLSITADDLRSAINDAVEKAIGASRQIEKQELPKHVHGLQGIADLFGVSKVTAQKYKNTWLSSAVAQQGKVLLTDTEKALKLFSEINEGGQTA